MRLTVDSARVADAEAVLFDQGAASVTLVDAGDTPIHEPDPGETPLWPVSVVSALFDGQGPARAGLLERLQSAGLVDGPADVAFEAIEDRDWERAWMDRFEPMRFGRDLWICPSHVEPDPGWSTVIRLDPGLAFGTGTHPTTALCLEWMDGRDLSGASVIDYGCGSGVLAIAAALKGAGHVLAIDHDPQALEATAANARLNGVADRLTIQAPGQGAEDPARVVLANILAGPLEELAGHLTGLVLPGGELVMSGMLAEQVESVVERYAGAFGPFDRTDREGWAAVAARRITTDPQARPNP